MRNQTVSSSKGMVKFGCALIVGTLKSISTEFQINRMEIGPEENKG